MAADIRSIIKALNLPMKVLAVLENVEYASPDFVTAASLMMHGPPMVVQASSFGWVRRPR